MVRAMWGLASAVLGLIYLLLCINALMGLTIPYDVITSWKAEELQIGPLAKVFGLVVLKFVIAWAGYKVFAYCWRRFRSPSDHSLRGILPRS